MILLMYCWIWFAGILLSVFASMFISDIGLYFSLFAILNMTLNSISFLVDDKSEITGEECKIVSLGF